MTDPGYGFAYFYWHRKRYYLTPPGDSTRYWRWDQFRELVCKR